MNLRNFIKMIFIVGLFFQFQCNEKSNPVSTYPDVSRKDKIPDDIEKRDPETDPHPPILHSTNYENPVPIPGAINTAGAEDSPFILPDGKTIYFFFTPDVRVPVEKQLLDDVTGVWVSEKTGDAWGEAERIWLQEPGKLALDGAVCIQGDEMWFASAREGYTGVNMFTAQFENDTWQNWKYCGDRLMKEIQIGEVHIHGNDLYFHSDRDGGKGDYDIWVTTRSGNEWSDPVNIEALNTSGMDGFVFLSSDGNQLWFTRSLNGTPAIYKSVKENGNWTGPELIVSQFAGEPTLDDNGNLYFVHHYYEHGKMIEADIYVAYKK